MTRSATETTEKGREVEKKWVRIDTAACTGCNLCVDTCGPGAIELVEGFAAGPGAGE